MEIIMNDQIVVQSTPPILLIPAPPITGSPTQLIPHAPPHVSTDQPPAQPTTPPAPVNNRSAAAVVVSPCAACKILRRRCVEKCVLAPYFPPTDPHKFAIAHRVFGAANIIKFLQELPEPQRADAVSSMVYEAKARLRDPVYGCAGAISQLQDHIRELQAELAKTQAQAVNIQCQNSNLIALVCMEMAHQAASAGPAATNCNDVVLHQLQQQQQQQCAVVDTSCFLEENSLGSGWEPLWA